ncbi:MAG: type II secretion system protein [Patescibacteria group bacterium]
MKKNNRHGFTYIEILMAAAIMSSIGLMILVNYSRQRPTRELASTKLRIVAVLREAATYSASQTEGAVWGVHFDAVVATSSFFGIFPNAYDASNIRQFNPLPRSLRFDTSNFTAGAKEITFQKINGKANASTTVRIYILADPTRSSTIRISSSGLISS